MALKLNQVLELAIADCGRCQQVKEALAFHCENRNGQERDQHDYQGIWVLNTQKQKDREDFERCAERALPERDIASHGNRADSE